MPAIPNLLLRELTVALVLVAVRAAIERLRAENPEGAVVIQGDREAQIGLLVQVMDQVRKAGVSNVSIAATPGE